MEKYLKKFVENLERMMVITGRKVWLSPILLNRHSTVGEAEKQFSMAVEKRGNYGE